MKRKNLMNDKVIKAMTLGLATMIAITSTPVSAFADEGDDATSNEDAATEYSDIEGVSDDAQDALNDASSSIESAVEYAEVSDGQELNVEDATIGNVIAGVYTPPAGVEVEGEYDPSKENVVNAGEVKEKTDAVINEMESIGENISDISSELIAAENLDIIEEKNAKDSVEAVNAAVEVAEDVEEYMEKASAEADELADSINNAENEQSARESFDKLQKLTEDAAEELEKANEILSDMEDKYSEAKKKLLDAERLYKKTVKDASDNEGKLEEKINNLQEEVDALESALKTAQDSAESTYKAALKILEAGVTTKDYRKLDNLFSAIMKGYYIPQSVADATDVEVSDWSWKEYDYDYNYCKVTYKVNGEEVTKYYNYIYKDEAGSKGIQIFEKSADEVGAAEYITSKYKNENDAKKAAESGIYAYTEDGETKYITGTEKEAVKSIKSDNNLITQNKQYSDNNMHIQATDEGLSAFLESDSDGAKAIKAAQEKVNQNNTWRLDDKLFEALMVNYYIPEVIAEGATNVTVGSWSLHSYNDSLNYCAVTYTTADGKTETKYYNYKRNSGDATKLDIFEKSENEVGAAKYIEDKYKDASDAMKAAKSGVYAYTENGETKYITGSELNTIINSSAVNQNASSEDGLYFNSKDDEKLNKYKEDAKALKDKYDLLEQEAAAAKNKLNNNEDLVNNINKLKGEIGDLENQDNKVISAIAEKKFDIAEFLGITDEEEKAKIETMTIAEALDYLDSRLDDARKAYELAKANYEKIEKKRDEAEEDLEEVIEKLEEEAAEDDTTGDDTTGDDTPSSSGGVYIPTVTPYVTTPVAIAGLPIAGVAGARRAEVAAVTEKAPVVEVKTENNITEEKTKIEKEEPLTTIKDEEVALAAIPEETKKDMNWWWLVVVAVLGSAGYELYRKHTLKKNENESVAQSIKKD